MGALPCCCLFEFGINLVLNVRGKQHQAPGGVGNFVTSGFIPEVGTGRVKLVTGEGGTLRSLQETEKYELLI